MASEESPAHYCAHCGANFICGKALGDHISSAHIKPNKNLLEEGKESSSCPVCPKDDFASSKSLHGHMRTHSDQDYRGMTPNPLPPKKIYNKFNSEESQIPAINIRTPKLTEKGAIVVYKGDSVIAEEEKSGEIASFTCNVCDKTFTTHQALGGHVASHKKRTMKVYNTMDDPKFNELKKRKLDLVKSRSKSSAHQVQSTQLLPSPVNSKTRVGKLGLDIDLNKTLEEQESVQLG